MFGRRAARAALAEPASAERTPERVSLAAQVGASTREALWRGAGLRRTREGARAAARRPLPARAPVATCALAREESRGAHVRTDFPDTDPALDAMHAVVDAGGAPALERWE